MSLLNKNDFELFGLTPGFAIDEAALKQRYHTLQQTVHPDRFAGGSDQERRLAVQLTARVNEAYQTLKSPLARLRYLLQLAGEDLSAETAALDAAFLGEQIELREQLADIRASSDARAGLAAFAADLEQRIATLTKEAAAAYQGGELQQAKVLYNKLQFLYRLSEEAAHLEGDQ